MPQSIRNQILAYCERRRIVVPPGFGRNTPSRYVVVRTDLDPPKLVATTWFKQADVVYYFQRILEPKVGAGAAWTICILDFTERKVLQYRGTARLVVLRDIDDESIEENGGPDPEQGKESREEAEPGATDNPDDAQRLREDH